MTVASELIAFCFGGVVFLGVALVSSVRDQAPQRRRIGWWWWWLLIATAVGMALLYGRREVVGDTEVYSRTLTLTREFGFVSGKEWLFNALAYLLTRIAEAPTALVMITTIVSVGMGVGLSRYLGEATGAALACAVFFTSFYCIGVQSNILRHGLALATLMPWLPELLFSERNVSTAIKAAIVCTLASGFHTSVAYVLVPALLIAQAIRFRVDLAAIAAFIFTCLAAFGWGIERLPFLGDFLMRSASEYSGYFELVNDARYYRVGFRPEFTLFVWFFAAWGAFVWYRLKLRDPWYGRVLVVYMLVETLFVCSFNIPFSDRIGLYGFVLIPIIVCYPFGRIRELSSIDSRMLLSGYVGLNFLFTLTYFGRTWMHFV